MLREGKGAPRNGQEAVELLRSASRQGMAAVDVRPRRHLRARRRRAKDPAMALAWFAITAEFERQTNRGGDDALAKTAAQRAQALQAHPAAGRPRARTAGRPERIQADRRGAAAAQAAALPAALRTAAGHLAGAGAATGGVPAPAQAWHLRRRRRQRRRPDPPGWPKAAGDQVQRHPAGAGRAASSCATSPMA